MVLLTRKKTLKNTYRSAVFFLFFRNVMILIVELEFLAESWTLWSRNKGQINTRPTDTEFRNERSSGCLSSRKRMGPGLLVIRINFHFMWFTVIDAHFSLSFWLSGRFVFFLCIIKKRFLCAMYKHYLNKSVCLFSFFSRELQFLCGHDYVNVFIYKRNFALKQFFFKY